MATSRRGFLEGGLAGLAGLAGCYTGGQSASLSAPVAGGVMQLAPPVPSDYQRVFVRADPADLPDSPTEIPAFGMTLIGNYQYTAATGGWQAVAVGRGTQNDPLPSIWSEEINGGDVAGSQHGQVLQSDGDGGLAPVSNAIGGNGKTIAIYVETAETGEPTDVPEYVDEVVYIEKSG